MKGYIKYLWHITDGFHRTAILRTTIGVVRVGVMLTFIWLSKTAIDCATGRTPVPVDTLILWFSLMVVCLIGSMLLSQCGRYIEARATLRMNNAISRRLFNILMRRPLVSGQQGFHSGDMLNRLTLDARTVSNFALSQLPNLVVMIVQLLGAFIFLALLNPYLALAPIIIMPLCVLASKLYFKRQRQLTADIREKESDMHVSLQEGLKHRTLLRSLECLPLIDHRIGNIQSRLDQSNKEQTHLSRLSGVIVQLGFISGYLTAFGWSIFSLRAGIITYGTMTAFIQLVNRIQNPIASLSGYVPAFISTSVALDRLRAIDLPSSPVLRASALKNYGANEVSTSGAAGICVKDLSFRYDADSRPILSRFSHDFRPGSRTMIVGSTGAGKTTLIKLLLGLLPPDSGSIEIYHKPQVDCDENSRVATCRDRVEDQNSGEAGLSEVKPSSSVLRASALKDCGANEVSTSAEATLHHFAYVPQGNTLLHGSIRDNLLLADPDASEEKLADVLHTAVADFVFDLPLGLDTPCDEAGGGLSEGQAQRIAIARALLRPGSIMILDEFNSALDADTAELLMRRLDAARPDATIIIIAHHRTAIAPYCHDILHIE